MAYILRILREDRLGCAPFLFKHRGDYWPDMLRSHTKIYGEDKMQYFKTRDHKLEKYAGQRQAALD